MIFRFAALKSISWITTQPGDFLSASSKSGSINLWNVSKKYCPPTLYSCMYSLSLFWLCSSSLSKGFNWLDSHSWRWICGFSFPSQSSWCHCHVCGRQCGDILLTSAFHHLVCMFSIACYSSLHSLHSSSTFTISHKRSLAFWLSLDTPKRSFVRAFAMRTPIYWLLVPTTSRSSCGICASWNALIRSVVVTPHCTRSLGLPVYHFPVFASNAFVSHSFS